MASSFPGFTGGIYQNALSQGDYVEPLLSPGISNHLRAEFYIQQDIGEQLQDASTIHPYSQRFSSPLSTPPQSQAQLPTASPRTSQTYQPPIDQNHLYSPNVSMSPPAMPPASPQDYVNLGSHSVERNPPPPYGAELGFGGTLVPAPGESFGGHSALNL